MFHLLRSISLKIYLRQSECLFLFSCFKISRASLGLTFLVMSKISFNTDSPQTSLASLMVWDLITKALIIINKVDLMAFLLLDTLHRNPDNSTHPSFCCIHCKLLFSWTSWTWIFYSLIRI